DKKAKFRAWKASQVPLPVPDRREMIAALKSEVEPSLRESGFTGSFPHFRRLGPSKTDCVTFQFDKYGGGFVVVLADGPAEEFVFPWGERVPAAKLTAHDLGGVARLATGPRPDGEQWFRYDTGADKACDSAARAVKALLPQVEAWFRGERHQHNIQSAI
ncbi:MAG: DUF4304 domain-containing protein, partial [Planctomycetes bacterium]|nr:DUF4304 domain-containing protein [Planctomycetota bacterium]